MITKGLVALLVRVLDRRSPQEILARRSPSLTASACANTSAPTAAMAWHPCWTA
jgi:sulfur transfer protein SufE